MREDPNSEIDYMTAKDFSYFLRVLYNSTYLKKDLSEKALELLNTVDFKDGLVAGVPNNITVAHKFGIKGDFANNDKNQVVNRELHDCGIVYHNQRPYLVCIMTKGNSSLQDSESVLKNISSMIYQAVDKDYK
jgi:hypothetical protein